MDRYAPAALTLIDGGVTIPIRPENPTAGDPVFCTSWDLGAPEVRINSTPRPGADGVDEGSGYLGASTVTLELLIRGDGTDNAAGHDPYWYTNQLAAMCHPNRRPVLAVTRRDETSGGKTWYLSLRGNPWALPFDRSSAARLAMTLTFTAPLGLFESDLRTVYSPTANTVAATDWHFPAAFPHGFGPTSGAPKAVCAVGGTSSINPILYINGPVTNPGIRDELGQKFSFDNLKLLDGQTVRIDMGAGSVLIANPETGFSETAADVFHTVDFETSTFWVWPPGTHTVSMINDTGSFAVQWRDRQLTI